MKKMKSIFGVITAVIIIILFIAIQILGVSDLFSKITSASPETLTLVVIVTVIIVVAVKYEI